MNLRKQLRESIGGIVIAVLLGGSLALTLCDAMGLAVDVIAVAVPCLVTALACALMTMGVWPLAVTLALLVAGGGATIYFKLPAYTQMEALVRALLTDGSLDGCLNAIAGVLGVLLTATAFLMTRVRGGVYPALTLLMLVAMGTWMFERSLNVYYVAPALVAVAMLFASSAREKTSFNSALPIAAVSVAAALLLMPIMGGVSPALQQFGRAVRSTVADYLMFSEARTLYSVQLDGYQSQSGKLGGDANPSDFPIMSVETDRTLLLRGAIKREYTGVNWVDSSLNSRSLFVSPLRRTLRNQVFGLNQLDGDELESAPEGLIGSVDVNVTFLSRGTSTLFTPHRLTQLSAEGDMIPYFNSSGEVFITRTVRAGDAYSFTALIPDTYSDDMDAYLSGLTGDGLAGSLDAYLQLPATLSTDVYDLTYSIIHGYSTPYQKARAIEDYLKANYAYTLTPGDTPEGSDFVSYFLLEHKAGYCTYFASAMGVMARIAGIPSRYVEGYLVQPDESGVTEVIGKDAHAWVELYFEGFGWLSFDPTPNDEPLVISPTPEPEQPDVATPTPSPTPEPTPEPSDMLLEPTTEPTEQPEPEPTLTPTSEPDEPPDEPPGLRPWLIALIALLILLLIAAIVALRLYISTPRYAVRKAQTSADKLMVYYRALLTVLEMQGQVPESGETPTAFAARLAGEKLAAQSFVTFTEIVVRSRYAGQSVTPEMCAAGATAYVEAVKSLHLREKLRWYRRRVRQGMGNVHQIP